MKNFLCNLAMYTLATLLGIVAINLLVVVTAHDQLTINHFCWYTVVSVIVLLLYCTVHDRFDVKMQSIRTCNGLRIRIGKWFRYQRSREFRRYINDLDIQLGKLNIYFLWKPSEHNFRSSATMYRPVYFAYLEFTITDKKDCVKWNKEYHILKQRGA